jgi:hypothetical protein
LTKQTIVATCFLSMGVVAIGLLRVGRDVALPPVAPLPSSEIPPPPGTERFGERHTASQVTQAPEIRVCDLRAHVVRTNGTLVRVKARFLQGFETSLLFDPSCERQMVWVSLDWRTIQRLSPVWASRRLNDLLAAAQRWGRGGTAEMNATFVGRIDGPKSAEGLWRDGHMGCCSFQLTVYAVEYVNAGP